jgi:uncharacterized membrane protein
MRADHAAARLHRRCWNRLSAGKGAKSDRNYEWAWLRITPPADDLIPLSVNEIRHLFAKLITNTIRTISYRLHWSTWRRQHRTRARTSHYARRGSLIDSHPSP